MLFLECVTIKVLTVTEFCGQRGRRIRQCLAAPLSNLTAHLQLLSGLGPVPAAQPRDNRGTGKPPPPFLLRQKHGSSRSPLVSDGGHPLRPVAVSPA